MIREMSLQSGATEQLTVAQTETTDGASGRLSPSLVLKLRKPKTGRRVGWSTDVVDNENLNKKKSKCCCIYTKPREFGESSSEDEDEKDCEHCSGHVERKPAYNSETITENSSNPSEQHKV